MVIADYIQKRRRTSTFLDWTILVLAMPWLWVDLHVLGDRHGLLNMPALGAALALHYFVGRSRQVPALPRTLVDPLRGVSDKAYIKACPLCGTDFNQPMPVTVK